ncbi:hypothetical protein ACS0PU_013189 [Formica fusca]
MEEPKYIARLEQYLWEDFIRVNSACSCELWEDECLKCLDGLEAQYRIRVSEGLAIRSLLDRIARLQSLRHSLRKQYKCLDACVPALSSNIPVNSVVQVIQGREIGLNKSYTDVINYRSSSRIGEHCKYLF